MKKHSLILIALFISNCTAFSQEQDAVMYSMYRYHPQKTISKLGIDSVFIKTVKEDTSYLSSIIVYDTLGRELKYIDVESNFEFKMDYYSSGLLKSSRLIDYDHGAGPIDSFSYNKKGRLKKSFYSTGGDFSIIKYKYKKSKLVKEKGESYCTKYTYKNGKRIKNTYYSNKKKVIRSDKTYEYNKEGNLSKIFENEDQKWLNFRLFYNENNLLTIMKVYREGLHLSQQYNTTYDKNGLITSRNWYISILNNDLKNCDFEQKMYSYSYRD